MNVLFLDSGYVIAVEVDTDERHARAVEHWRRTKADTNIRLVSTSFVFDEIATFLNSRRLHDRAVEVGNRLLNSPTLNLLDVDRTLLSEGGSYFQQHDDKRYSLTDCISFVVMKRMNIATALTFDQHFRQAGFHSEP
jgi:uncharacterized protein